MSTNFRIIDDNYIFSSVTSITATSADTSFPVTNVADTIRAKTWRSTTHFEIDSTNNKLDFSEDGVGEDTATLTAGNYTASTLATELKTQLEAASSNGRTYTVSFSTTTGLWTIAGQTYLDLLFSTGTNVATSVHSSLGFAGSDYSGAVTYNGAFVAFHTYEAVSIDLLSPEPVDSFALLFDQSEGVQFTPSATLKLQGNATNEWSSPAVDVTLSFDENKDSITHFFSSDQEYRYWRVYIEDASNQDFYIEFGTIFLGKGTQLTRSIDSGFKFELEDQSKLQETQYGHQYVDTYPIRKRLIFDYNLLSYTDVATLDNLYRRVGIQTPVYVVLDGPEELFDKDHFSIYGRFQKRMSEGHLVNNKFKVGLTITETM